MDSEADFTSKTLKELRELRGLTLEELADRTNIPKTKLRRWEEVGLDAAPYTTAATLAEDNLESVLDVLDADNVTHPSYTPSTPEPGQLVMDCPDNLQLMNLLWERADELALRVAVPSKKWVTLLKEPPNVTLEDVRAIHDHEAAEIGFTEALDEADKE